MRPMESWQRSNIYGIARTLGIDNDDLHSLVAGLTDKTSLKELSFGEAAAVIAELKVRQKAAGVSAPRRPKKRSSTPGGVTSEQQGKIWALMYELEKHDPPKGGATVGDRLCGLITNKFHVTAPPAQPFRFLKMAQGMELIDTLKAMAERAELKALHEGRVRYG